MFKSKPRTFFVIFTFLVVMLFLSQPLLVYSEVSFGKQAEFTLQENAKEAEDKTDQLFVKFKPKTTKNAQRVTTNALSLYGLESVKKNPISQIEVVKLKDSNDLAIEDVLEELRNDPTVEYVGLNHKIFPLDLPQDLNFASQWGIQNTGQIISGQKGTKGVDINGMPAWEFTRGNNTITVGVLDSGVDIRHSDLSGGIWINPGESGNRSANGIDDDYNGYADDVHGWDFAADDPSVFDSSTGDKHGTHVAGIIAASANSIGVIGVAPEVKIVPLKFITLQPDGEVYGYVSDAIEAIEYAKMMGVEVINCSWGGPDSDNLLRNVMENSGILFICAAGNSIFNTPSYPAFYDLPNIISVAAIDNSGRLASFSNRGNSVDIAAPGVNIYSTLPGNRYGYLSGTSMAAPHVTGIAALIRSRQPELPIMDIKAKIQNGITTSDLLKGQIASGGMADAYAALNPPEMFDINAVSTQNSIALTWAPIAGATSYEVEVDGVIVRDSASTSYTLYELITNSTHIFRVRANKGTVPGNWSNRLLKTTLDQTYGSGLRAEYFSDMNLDEPYFIVNDRNIDTNWSITNSDSMAVGDINSVRWLGRIKVFYNEEYTFHLQTDGGVRLWIGDSLLIDQWNNEVDTEFSANTDFYEEWRQSIKVEFRKNKGVGKVSLLWSSDSQTKEIVPSGNFFSSIYIGKGGGEWSILQSMPTRRYSIGAAAANGKLYVFGGLGGFNGPEDHWSFNMNTVEEYDLLTNTWTVKNGMPSYVREFATAAVDDKVYIMGGSNTNYGMYSSRVEAYEPQTDTWTVKSSMLTGRHALTAAEVNGKIYAIGGFNESGLSNSMEEYDPTTNTWVKKRGMPTASHSSAAVSLNGKIYVIGGSLNPTISGKLEIYDPIKDTWEIAASMPTPRYGCTAAVLNGKIYVFGGRGPAYKIYSTVEEYDPIKNTWTTKENMPTQRSELAAATIEGFIYTVGGWIDDNVDANEVAVNNLERYSPINNSVVNPRTAAFDKTAENPKDIQLTLVANTNALTAIQNEGYTLVPEQDYIVSDHVVTLKEEYLSKLSLGTAVLDFDFSAGKDSEVSIVITASKVDISKDGKVDIDDLVLMALAYNSIPEDANWNENADLNQDGRIDMEDLAMLGSYYD